MPIIVNDETKLSPYVVSDRMAATKPSEPTAVEKPGVMETVKAAFEKSNWAVRIAQPFANNLTEFNKTKQWPTQVDENFDKSFNPFNADNLKGYEDHADWFAEAKNKKESDYIKSRIDERRSNEDILKRAGGWGTAADFAAALFTPDILLGVGGIGVKAFKGAQLMSKAGALAVDGAIAGGVSGALYGGGQSLGNPTYGGTDFAKDVALGSAAGALLNPAFSGAGYVLGKTYRKVRKIGEYDPTPQNLNATTALLNTHINAAWLPPESQITLNPLLPDHLSHGVHPVTQQAGQQAAAQVHQSGTLHNPVTPQQPFNPLMAGDMNLVGTGIRAERWGLGQAAVHLANSRFIAAKEAAQQLFRDMRWRKGNLDGSFTTMPSAETEFERIGRAAHGQAIEFKDKLYREYLDTGWSTPSALQHTRSTYGKDKMTRAEFENEIGIAMSNADRHGVREVTQVAQHGRTIIDDLAQQANRLGLMDTTGNLKQTALSYFGRSYDRDKIIADAFNFKQTLEREFARTNPHFTPTEISAAAQATYEHIINGSNSSLSNIRTIVQDVNGNFIPVGNRTRAGQAMERKLEVDDNVLQPWLDKSYANFIRRYTNDVGKQIALTKMIGDSTGERLLERLAAENRLQNELIDAKAISNEAKSVERTQLDKDYNKAVYYVKNGVSMLNGTYKVSANPSMSATNAANNIMKFNYITKLGGAAISSLSDITKNVLVFGLMPTLKHTLPAIRNEFGKMWRGNFAGIKNANYDQIVQANKRIGIGLESALHSRQMEMADILEQQVNRGTFTTSLDYAAEKMGKLNLLDQLTDIQKSMTGVIANDEFIRSCIAESLGKASQRELANLRRFGIDPSTSQRIATEFTSNPANSIKDGFYLTDTKAWTDTYAAETLERALSTATHSIVYNPSAGAKVSIPNSFFGKDTENMITQFLSFNFGSHIQHTVPMLQKIDMATFNYVVASAIMGSVVYEIKQSVRFNEDRERPERSYKQMVWDAIDQSGLAALPYTIHGVASGVTGGFTDVRRFLGDDQSRTFSGQNLNLGSLAGPTGTTVNNIYNVASNIATDDVDKKTIHTARQLIPFQNLFYLRGLFDEAEQWAQEELDVPDKAVYTITKRRNQ